MTREIKGHIVIQIYIYITKINRPISFILFYNARTSRHSVKLKAYIFKANKRKQCVWEQLSCGNP